MKIFNKRTPYGFEIAFGAAAKNLYKNINIKYCIWHLPRSLENKKNNLCKADILNNDNLYSLYNVVCNLFLYNPYYIKLLFDKIKSLSMII